MNITHQNKVVLDKIIFERKLDGIIYVSFCNDVELNILDFIDWSAAMKVFCEDRKYPVLIDLSNIKNFSQEIVNYAINEERANEYAIATAIVVKNSMDRILGNFILKLTNPYDGSQLFSTQEKAISWLAFVKESNTNPINLN